MTKLLPESYTIENFKDAINNPEKLIREFKRLTRIPIYTIGGEVEKGLFKHKYGSGIQVMEQDWDDLIILDACRYPEFEQNCELDGELKSVVSKGSTSREWIRKNFVGREFHDTVYVGGNPHMEKFSNEFYWVKKSYSASGTHENYKMAEGSIPGWHPEAVYESAIEAIGECPNKRRIIHFMQPHDPYIGSKAEELRNEVEERENVVFKKRRQMAGEDIQSEDKLGCLRSAAGRGYISHDQLLEVYIENLDIVLDYVQDLLSELNGKAVITADHGELLGAGRFTSNKYGHPIGVYQSELRIVPWLEINNGNRRDIYSQKPVGVEEADDEVVEEQLKALGYK